MIYKLYAMYDRAGQMFGNIFQVPNDGLAKRSAVHFLAKLEPYDRDSFVLMALGEFDDEHGAILPYESNILVDFTMPSFEDVQVRKVVPEVDNESRS